jgi:hypothetical protein
MYIWVYYYYNFEKKIMEISVSRKSHFNAAHRLNVDGWSKEKNKAVFGLCNNEKTVRVFM